MPFVPDLLREVLDRSPPRRTFSSWKPRQIASVGRSRSSAASSSAQLAGVAVRLRRVGRGVAVGAVVGRVDVDAAREDDPVEHVERLLDRVLARRHDERPPAGLLDRVDVVERARARPAAPTAPHRAGCAYEVMPMIGRPLLVMAAR